MKFISKSDIQVLWRLGDSISQFNGLLRGEKYDAAAAAEDE